MSMFGSLVQRLTSPVTSPSAPRRRFKSPARFEVQSEPEDEAGCGSGPTRRKSRAAKHLLDKRRAKSRQSPRAGLVVGAPQPVSWHEAAFPPLRCTKSLGRLDGLKEVISFKPFCFLVFCF